MMRSLYSGVTGLRNHQTRMDVIGNNIANVNTVGFKSSRVIFQDIYSQTLAPASGADADSGGTNPKQIGLGMTLATIDVMQTRSSSQYTGNPLDLSIEGEGFFVISNSGALNYTRAGNFYTDADNNLVNSNGYFVQGYEVAADGSGDLVLDGFGDPIRCNVVIDPNYYDVTISSNGQIVGLDEATNDTHVIGQIILGSFSNDNGLEKVGQNMYRSTVNSGAANLDTPGSGGTGQLNPGTLEMTNVDLANEFTDMIVTQRGFQANSRVITTTDQMLEELVNLKR